MQGLDNLSKSELLDLLHAFEQRVAELESGATLARGAQPGIDFIYQEALLVLGTSGIPAFIYDTGMDAQGRDFAIIGANQSMAVFTGYPIDELMGMSVLSLLVHADRLGVRRLLSSERPGGFMSSGWRHRTRSGEIREVEASGYDLEYRGRRARLVIAQDVTRRKHEQLTQQRLASIVENSHDAIIAPASMTQC